MIRKTHSPSKVSGTPVRGTMSHLRSGATCSFGRNQSHAACPFGNIVTKLSAQLQTAGYPSGSVAPDGKLLVVCMAGVKFALTSAQVCHQVFAATDQTGM